MKIRLLIIIVFSFLLTGCLNNDGCLNGYEREKDLCVMVESMKAVRKKEEVCLSGYEINGNCYMTDSTANVHPSIVEDENGNMVPNCPGGYRLENDVCKPVANGTTSKEYYECQEGYTFDESGIKTTEGKEKSGIKKICYKRFEVKPED